MTAAAIDRLLLDPTDRREELTGDFRTAMRRAAASVAVITAAHQGRRGGLTATALCPVSVEPASLLICVNRSANTHALIAASGRFAVNLLDQGQRGVAEAFAGRTGLDGDDKFGGAGLWESDESSLPVLSGAVAFISCDVIRRVEVETHSIFIGLVKRAIAREAGLPLVYADRNFVRLSE
jgi:flavin reductase (DIM6/NTAB) family NADH-FMN oxidoreductase RutF